MRKPLHKDPSFWIVAITLVGAANVAQFNFGVPWLRGKIAASRPAPRMTNAVPVLRASESRQPSDLDLSRKTYSWQRLQYDPSLLPETPPQVVLIPSEYTGQSGGWGIAESNRAIGIRMPAPFVLHSAYGWTSPRRVITADKMPAGEFDFIANLPNGALEALQAEIKKQWGIVATREFRQTNALILKLDHTNAPGLQLATRSPLPPQIEAGAQTMRFRTMNVCVSYLESMLRRPVIDQTGLTGIIDIQLPMNSIRPGTNNDSFEQTRTVLLERLGLDLIPTNATVEMLVVKKASEGNP